MLWLAIVGTTADYTDGRFGDQDYEQLAAYYRAEAQSMAPADVAAIGDGTHAGGEGRDKGAVADHIEPADVQGLVIPCTDYRCPLLREWSLQEAMQVSPYIGARLGFWLKHDRVDRLKRLLVRIGISAEEASQHWSHVKRRTAERLRGDKADMEFQQNGIPRLTFDGFEVQRGFSRRVSALDVATATAALLECGIDTSGSAAPSDFDSKAASASLGSSKSNTSYTAAW